MKKYTSHIIALLVISLAALTGCADDYSGGWLSSEQPVSMKIVLNLPIGPSFGETTRAASDELAAERRMDEDGIRLLIFENGELKEDVEDKQLSDESNGSRTLTAKSTNSYKSAIEVVVLANMNKNSINFTSNKLIGKSKEEVYKTLKYTYGTTAWDVVNNNQQYIPMWGAFRLTPSSGQNNVTVSLYRAVSKINVLVNEGTGLDNFKLTSARVYFANQEGYAAPLVEPTSPKPVATPSVESTFGQFDVANPLIFEVAGGTTALSNQIYVPESNNIQPASNRKALCLVVGGYYTGAGLVAPDQESFYRVEFKDESGIYDALRNHLYIFNIRKVSSPGTPTPEKALDNAVVGINVTIEKWNETSLNGLGSQYSLATDKSRISFLQGGGEMAVTVSSDYTEAWEVTDVEGDWFSYKISGNRVVVSSTANYGASRDGSFCIQSGKIKKQILVDQAQPGTANCYLVGVGENEMTVVVKGNGTAGLKAENKNNTTEILDNSAILTPAYLSVIWETEEGLVKLIDHTTGSQVSENAHYNTEKGVLRYVVKNNPQVIDNKGEKISGGNALIGAFDQTGNIIWSWHIWVCPEMLQLGEKIDQYWDLTGYSVMDRNLGALTNKPGVGSLGLLYQWGRKDPLIGAGSIVADSERMTTKNYFSNHDWVVAEKNEESKTVEFTIKNPTKMIHDGLLTSKKGPFLWGTNGGLDKAGIKDLGRKTIYDPCPVGYRVPPVDAFVFKGEVTYQPESSNDYPYSGQFHLDDVIEWFTGEGKPSTDYASNDIVRTGPGRLIVDGKELMVPAGEKVKILSGRYYTWSDLNVKLPLLRKTSETKNWLENLVYIPYNLTTQSQENAQWDTHNYVRFHTVRPVENALHYGYYLNYNEVKVPKMKEKSMYELEPGQNNITWLPLSGAYDPTKGFTFEKVTIEEGPSLTVNSFIWTNSSVVSDDNTTRPGAMFLHGANPDPEKHKDGRHIHALIKKDIKAEPHYAGAVRCVRDTKKDFGNDNKVPETIALGKDSGSLFKATVISINESWQVIDPGAPWVSITPDRGVADKGNGTQVTFIATQANNGAAPRTAIVKIRIGSNDTREVTVTQAY